MKTVRLKREVLIDSHNHAVGDVVKLADVRAAAFIKKGYAEAADEGTEVKNKDFNPLVDAITPLPPDGVNASPQDAIVPTVENSHGLMALENADKKAGNVRKAAKILAKPGET